MSKLKNNISVLLDEHDISVETSSFSEFIRNKRKELQYQTGSGKRREYFPLKTLATNLGISQNVLEGKIYRKPGKGPSRDWVIAISAALGLNSFDTNKALLLCSFPQLDADLPREDFLIDFLEKHEGEATKLSLINSELQKEHLLPLCGSFDRKNEKRKTTISDSFNVIRRLVKTYKNVGEQYDSLETAFPFYYCTVEEYIRTHNQVDYVLEASTYGDMHVYTKGEPIPKHYMSIEETGRFAPMFTDILSYVKKEQQRIDEQLFDTKNYRGRLGAGLKYDRLHVFYEEYNYSFPERNEYYLMEYINGHLQLSISQQSMFMKEYLSAEDYSLHYSMYPQKQRKTYQSLSEIDALLEKTPKRNYYHDIILEWHTAFIRLSKKVNDAVEQIKNKTLFIRHLKYIYDNPGEICSFFGIEHEFGCTYDDEYGEITVGKNEAIATTIDGKTLSITFEELARAFELGFENWDQIIRIKAERNSIENIF